MNNQTQSNIIIKLGEKEHNQAHKLAKIQGNPSRFKQSYLNVLAVLAVNKFLLNIGYQGDLNQSDSLTILQRLENTGHLRIADLGVNLECRAVLPNQTEMIVPTEATNRDFYVGVHFQESLGEVKLLGFCTAKELDFSSEDFATIELKKLTDIEELIDELFFLEQEIYVIRKQEDLVVKINKTIENVSLAFVARKFKEIYDSKSELDERYEACQNVLYLQSEFEIDSSQQSSELLFANIRKDSDSFDFNQETNQDELDEIAIELFDVLQKHWEEQHNYDDNYPEVDTDESLVAEASMTTNPNIVSKIDQAIISLTQMAKGIFPDGYMSIKEAMERGYVPVSMGGSSSEQNEPRAKELIQIGYKEIELDTHLLLLRVDEKTSENIRQYRFILSNAKLNKPLPSELELVFEDKEETISFKIKERKNKNKFEIKFNKNMGDSFDLKIILGAKIEQEKYNKISQG